MADRGVDAMILLGNNAVVYATGTSWPLGDAGLSYVERPVAVVLADDEWPHLFLPFREGAAHESELPADHLHGPVYLEFDEGVADFARVLADLIPAGAVVAVDECTGAMSRAGKPLFPNGAPVDAAAIVSAAKAIKTPDELSCMRTAIRITDEAMVEVHKRPGPRNTPDRPVGKLFAPRLRVGGHRQHARTDLAGDAAEQGRGRVDHARRLGAAVAEHRA